jgi:hypothetical protein
LPSGRLVGLYKTFASESARLGLLGLLVALVLLAARAVLGELELVRRRALVLVRMIVALFADGAFERDEGAISTGHFKYL